MPEQDLRLNVEAVGAPQAAQQLQSVAAAQEKITTAQGDSAGAVGKAAEQQEQSNKADADFLTLLTRVNPFLGEKTRAVVKLVKEMGDLATQQFKLTDLFKDGAGAAAKNADSLKLIAAGGAVAAGIAAIAFTVANMAQAFREATQAIQDNARALDDLNRKRQQTAQTMEDLRAASKAGPFTAEQAQAAGDTFAAVRQRFPFVDEGALKETIAATGGAADFRGGGGLSIEEIARAARLKQVDPERINLRSEDTVRRALDRRDPMLDKEFDREALQRSADAQKALQQSQQAGGSTVELQNWIGRFAQAGQSLELLARLAQNLAGKDLNSAEQILLDASNPMRPDLMFNKFVARKLDDFGIAANPLAQASPQDIATLRAAMTELRDAVKDLAKSKVGGVTNIHHNSRFFGPSAATQAQLMKNAASTAAEIE